MGHSLELKLYGNEDYYIMNMIRVFPASDMISIIQRYRVLYKVINVSSSTTTIIKISDAIVLD
jgi:hypothetical protein